MVNSLSMFCPELQKFSKPIYDLTRKGRPFVWQKEQQDSFDEIKCRLVKPPVLHMPNTTVRFHLYSDTSKFVMDSAFYQIQNGKPKLIAYSNKRLLEAGKNYSIRELELYRVAINIRSFSHLPKRVDFDAIVYHLELIGSYSFKLYYMVLSDFLSRQKNDNSNPHEIIPISFNMYKIVNDNYYNMEKYLIQTISQARSSSIKLPEVHGKKFGS